VKIKEDFVKKALLLVILIVVAASARPRWIDTNKINEVVISTFNGAGTEWVKYSTFGSIADSSAGICLVSSTNGAANIKKVLASTVVLTSDLYLRLSLYIDSVKNFADDPIFIYLSSDNDAFNNYHTINNFAPNLLATTGKGNPGSENNAKLNGNFDICIPISMRVVANGSPDESAIKTIGISLRTSPTTTSYIILKELSIITNTRQKGTLIFSNDDPFQTYYDTAVSILSTAGFKGVTFAAQDLVGTTNYQTVAELRYLQDTLGWDICNHMRRNINYSMSTIDTFKMDADSSQSWMLKNGLDKCRRFMAWPHGGYNQKLLDTAKQFYDFARGITQWVYGNALPMVQPLEFNQSIGYYPTDSANMKKTIDSIIKFKTFSFITTHGIGPAATPKDVFQSVINYAKSKADAGQLNVTTLSKYFVFSPDSCINEKASSATCYGFTVTDSIGTDADSMKLILQDSIPGGTWTQRAQSAMLKGGSTVTLTRTGASPGTQYFYRVIGQANSGTYDSTFGTKSITTKSGFQPIKFIKAIRYK
jgi:hypothetical protein